MGYDSFYTADMAFNAVFMSLDDHRDRRSALRDYGESCVVHRVEVFEKQNSWRRLHCFNAKTSIDLRTIATDGLINGGSGEV